MNFTIFWRAWKLDFWPLLGVYLPGLALADYWSHLLGVYLPWPGVYPPLVQPFMSPVTFSEVLAGFFWSPVTFSEVVLAGSQNFMWPRIWPLLSKVYCEMDTFCAKSGAVFF